MFKKVDHMAIAVKNLEETKKKLVTLLGAKFIVENVNKEGQYRVAIFRIGENIFTFLESTSPEGFVAKHIERSGETLQHMGIEVDDIQKFMDHLHANGVKTSNYVEIAGVRKEVLVGIFSTKAGISSGSSCRYSNGWGNTGMPLRRKE